MKILLDCTYLRNIHTGVDEYFFGLISSILEIDSANNYIIFIDSRYDDKKLIELIAKYKNYSIKRLYSPFPLQVLYSSFMFPFYLWLKNIDVYHNPYMFGPLFKIGKTKIIITVHDLFHRTVPQKMNKYISKVFRYLSEPAIKKSDCIIVISTQTKTDVIKYLEIDKSRIHLVHQALRHKNKSYNVNNIKNLPSLNNKYILTVGAVLPSKGLDDLLRAFKLFISNNPTTKYTLISVGRCPDNYIDELKELAVNLQISPDYVHFLGYVNDDELNFLYSKADFVVIPSYYEGFGVPVLEAMQYNKPVICRNAASLIEVAGDAGLLFNNVQELVQLMNELSKNEDIKKELIEKGISQLLNFSSEKRAHNTLSIYTKKLN